MRGTEFEVPLSGCPRIKQWSRNVLKVRCIARSQNSVVGDDNAGDHGVAQVARATPFEAGRHQVSGALRSRCIEGGDSTVHLVEECFKGLEQCGSPLPCGHDLQSELDLENRDGGCPDGCAWLVVEPDNDILSGL
jgi:hypothetical protein